MEDAIETKSDIKENKGDGAWFIVLNRESSPALLKLVTQTRFKEDEWLSQGNKEGKHSRQKKPPRHAAQRENVPGMFGELHGIQCYWSGEKWKIRPVNEEPGDVSRCMSFAFPGKALPKYFLYD